MLNVDADGKLQWKLGYNVEVMVFRLNARSTETLSQIFVTKHRNY